MWIKVVSSGALTFNSIKRIKLPQQICDFSPHSLCNGSNSPPPSPLSLFLSLHPVLPSAFTFCSPPVREQILSSLRMTLQSALQQIEELSAGSLFLCLISPVSSRARGRQRLTSMDTTSGQI